MAPTFPGPPAVADPARYRRSDRIPRQRVAYLGPGGSDDHSPATPQWSGSGPSMYDTDWTPRRRRRHRARRSGRAVSVLIAMGALSAAVGGVVMFSDTDRNTTTPVAVDAGFQPRPATSGSAASASAAPAKRSAPAAATRSPKATRAPEPVAGLNQTQMNNAAVIVKVAQEQGLPRRAILVAMMTGLQESSLRNLANTTIPASLDRTDEGSGDNFDSLGIFQQRPSQGWGTVAQLMNPRYAADAFYERLLRVADWESKSLGDAAQAVQRSALPEAYAGHERRAIQVVDALL